MKLHNAFGLLFDLFYAIRVALLPTIREVVRAPALLFHPIQVSRMFMAFVWTFFGDVTDESGRATKSTLITPNAYSVVLDLGAGHGHTLNYLDRTKVTKYVALEPNTRMHDEIRKKAKLAGYSEEKGTFLLLPYGAEDIGTIVSALGGPHSVDTIISVLTLCSVPEPEATISALVDQALKPGGKLLFYEHVRSEREDVAWWQSFWTPIWKVAFDGCIIGRPCDAMIARLDVWQEKEISGLEGEDPENLFIHSVGKLTKRA